MTTYQVLLPRLKSCRYTITVTCVVMSYTRKNLPFTRLYIKLQVKNKRAYCHQPNQESIMSGNRLRWFDSSCVMFMRRTNLFIFVQVVIHGSVLNLQTSTMCYLAVNHSTSSRAFRFLFESTSIPSTISLFYGFSSFLKILKI